MIKTGSWLIAVNTIAAGRNNEPVTGKDLSAAVDCLLEGLPASIEQRPSVGCNIKWKSGEEPDYFNV